MSAKSKGRPMPWWPRDFAADEHVLLMTLEVEGAYRRLLDHQWLHGSIPEDLGSLRVICKSIPAKKMREIWSQVCPRFCPREGHPGRLVNPRLERVREDVEAHAAKKAAAGIKGMATRWPSDNRPDNTVITDPITNALPPSPSPSPSPLTATAAAARETAGPSLDYLTRCVMALNAGLADNPDLGRTATIVPASGQVGAVSWQADGIPLELAEETIRERARAYRPTPRHRQPNSLRYFDAAVREAHERQTATPEDEDARFARLRAKLEAEEAVA